MQKKFDITGMGCSACSARIEKGISKLNGVSAVSVNLLTNSMVVTFDENALTSRDICTEVDNLGYGAEESADDDGETDGHRRGEITYSFDRTVSENHADGGKNKLKDLTKGEITLKKRLIISIIFCVPLFAMCMVPYLHHSLVGLLGSHIAVKILEIVLMLPIIIVNFKFYRVGLPMLFRGAPNMDSLIAVGTIASISIGYFDSVGVILTFVTLGKWLEERAKDKTTDALKGLMSLVPDTVTVIRDGEELTVKTSAVRVGETLIARPGEKFAVDGVITKGETKVNQSAITGESLPVALGTGDKVIGGTINIDGFITYQATAVAKDTTVAQIIKLVEDASLVKAPISRLADKVSGIFVPTVIGIAILTTCLWAVIMYFTGVATPIGIIAWQRALNFGISVLVISCPCALGLATPVAIMVGTGRGAKEGIIIKSGASLETLQKVDTIVFDKTGTLTMEAPKVTENGIEMTGMQNVLKPNARELIQELHKMGKHTILITGDKKQIAEDIASTLGIEKVYSEVFPQDKESIVRELQSEGRLVAMVGDGVNDAPALTRADVGIAIGNGTDIAIDSADMVLMKDDILDLLKAIKVSRETIKNIKQSLFWAFFYNAVCIPLAGGVLYPAFHIVLSPMIASALMSLSSVTVVTNSLRLKNKKI